METIFHCGLRWPPVNYVIHNNQPKTCGKGEQEGGTGRRWDWGGARRQCNTIILGVIVIKINRNNYPIIIWMVNKVVNHPYLLFLGE
jgi:hypothetical protein